MTKVDFKYTSLFWKLGFVEGTTDLYIKEYTDLYHIDIEAEKQIVNYGFNNKKSDDIPTTLYEHKDFVVLECVNRLLEKGYKREDLLLTGNVASLTKPDIIVHDNLNKSLIAFDCRRWGRDFEDELANIKQGESLLFAYIKNNIHVKCLCLYTSRLDGGLLEYKNAIISTLNVNHDKNIYFSGIFEENITPFSISLSLTEQERQKMFDKIRTDVLRNSDGNDYVIEDGILIKYQGNSEHIRIPDSIINIGTGAFWNCASLVSVEIPNGVESIGGDSFYYCHNLKSLSIPKSVKRIGNDPFAGCPLLTLTNESTDFILEDGVLYDKTKTTIIHYPINKNSKKFIIPDGVKYIGKHAFYNCINLKSITIPNSVICIENNAFADCKYLTLKNESSYFVLENGILYNKEKTQIISLIDHQLESLDIPNSVLTIGKNVFWNCVNLKSVIIPKSITRIGYNPFAGSNSLVLNNNSPHFILENGILYNKEKTEIISCPNTSISENISIPKSVKNIGRNAFSQCVNLKTINIPSNITIIERGAFSGCRNLSSIHISESVKFIGKWAFANCKSLKIIEIPESAVIEDYAFAECPAKIILIS